MHDSGPSHTILLRAPITNVKSVKVNVTSFEYNGNLENKKNVHPNTEGFVECVKKDAEASVMRVFPNTDVSLSSQSEEIRKGSLVTFQTRKSVARSPKRLSSPKSKRRQKSVQNYIPLPRVVVDLTLTTGRSTEEGFPNSFQVSKELKNFSNRCAIRLKKKGSSIPFSNDENEESGRRISPKWANVRMEMGRSITLRSTA